MEGPKAPSEARRREAPECRAMGNGEGAVAPSQYGGLGTLPQKIWKFNSANLFIFPLFQDKDTCSMRCISFVYCLYHLYLFIIDHPDVFRKVSKNAIRA